MIDTSGKQKTLRKASAEARVRMSQETAKAVAEKKVPKGDVLEVARVAGVLAAKKTPELIPLCHPLPVDFVGMTFDIQEDAIVIQAEVKAVWKTGVEMEALTAVSVAALTVYDMLKPIDQNLAIESVRLVSKSGGKSDFEESFSTPLKTAVLVISDSTYRGEREDKSGKVIQEHLIRYPVQVEAYRILPDDRRKISQEIIRLSDEEGMDLILTTGGTGLGPKDVTPEATLDVIERTAPGITEAMRSYGMDRTPYAMLSRNVAGVRGRTLVVNLPGSSRGAKQSMEILVPAVFHAIKMLRGGGHEKPRGKT